MYFNKDEILKVTQMIENENEKKDAAFSEVVLAMSRLAQQWEGAAAKTAETAFDRIKTNTRRESKENLMNIIRFLKQVAGMYEKTEQKNKSLVEYFE